MLRHQTEALLQMLQRCYDGRIRLDAYMWGSNLDRAEAAAFELQRRGLARILARNGFVVVQRVAPQDRG
jgi:hypothetical protein